MTKQHEAPQFDTIAQCPVEGCLKKPLYLNLNHIPTVPAKDKKGNTICQSATDVYTTPCSLTLCSTAPCPGTGTYVHRSLAPILDGHVLTL